MKKGFFLLAAMASLFDNRGIGGINIHSANQSLKNCPNRMRGGKPSKGIVTNILTNKMKAKKRLNKISKQSRNINHKKAA